MSHRFNTLDQLKGLACVLMIFAHSSKLLITRPLPYEIIYFIGGYAIVLFYAASGISIDFQIKKRNLISILMFYVIFFVLSFANQPLFNQKILFFSDRNIFFTIAMAGIIMALIVKLKINYWWVFTVPAIAHFIMVYYNFTYTINPTIRPLFVYPSLGLFPWLSFFLIGHRFFIQTKKVNVILTVLFIAGFLATKNIPFYDINFYNKYTMTVSYYFSSLAIFGITYCLVSYIKIPGLSYLGKNSFLFWYIHWFIILESDLQLQPALAWVYVLIASSVLIMALNFINRKIPTYSNNWLFWIAIIFFIFYIPYNLKDCFYAITIIIALNYHDLINLIEKPFLKRKVLLHNKKALG